MYVYTSSHGKKSIVNIILLQKWVNQWQMSVCLFANII